jgi:hypothetical protein
MLGGRRLGFREVKRLIPVTRTSLYTGSTGGVVPFGMGWVESNKKMKQETRDLCHNWRDATFRSIVPISVVICMLISTLTTWSVALERNGLRIDFAIWKGV